MPNSALELHATNDEAVEDAKIHKTLIVIIRDSHLLPLGLQYKSVMLQQRKDYSQEFHHVTSIIHNTQLILLEFSPDLEEASIFETLDIVAQERAHIPEDWLLI